MSPIDAIFLLLIALLMGMAVLVHIATTHPTFPLLDLIPLGLCMATFVYCLVACCVTLRRPRS